MSEELISVIIPCYNQGRFLTDAVNSLISQTYTNWECLIINDGSTDNTTEIAYDLCKKDKRVKLFYKENGGLSSARNEGLKNAKGDFIQFLDADDFIDQFKFEKQLIEFNTHENLTVSYTNFIYLNSNGVKENNPYKRIELKANIKEDFFLNWGFEFVIPIHCALFNVDFIKKNNLSFNEKLKAREDWFFWLRLADCGGQFKYYNEILAIYRRHEKSMVYNESHMLKNTLLACFKIHELMPLDYKNEFEEKYSKYLVNIIDNVKLEYISYQNSRFYQAHEFYKKIKKLLK